MSATHTRGHSGQTLPRDMVVGHGDANVTPYLSIDTASPSLLSIMCSDACVRIKKFSPLARGGI